MWKAHHIYSINFNLMSLEIERSFLKFRKKVCIYYFVLRKRLLSELFLLGKGGCNVLGLAWLRLPTSCHTHFQPSWWISWLLSKFLNCLSLGLLDSSVELKRSPSLEPMGQYLLGEGLCCWQQLWVYYSLIEVATWLLWCVPFYQGRVARHYTDFIKVSKTSSGLSKFCNLTLVSRAAWTLPGYLCI